MEFSVEKKNFELKGTFFFFICPFIVTPWRFTAHNCDPYLSSITVHRHCLNVLKSNKCVCNTDLKLRKKGALVMIMMEKGKEKKYSFHKFVEFSFRAIFIF